MKCLGGLKHPALCKAMRMRTLRIDSTRHQHGGGAHRTSQLDYLHDIYISQTQGGVQWRQLDQNGHILRAGICVACCQFHFKIYSQRFGRTNRTPFQNKPPVSFRISFSVLSPHVCTDTRSRFISYTLLCNIKHAQKKPTSLYYIIQKLRFGSMGLLFWQFWVLFTEKVTDV